MRYSHHSMVAIRSVCIGKILLHGLGYRYEDITEGEPIHDVEKNKRAGKHYSRHTVLKKTDKNCDNDCYDYLHLWFLDFADSPSKPTLETLKSHIKISLIDQFDLNIAEGSKAQARWKSLTQALNQEWQQENSSVFSMPLPGYP